MVLVFGIFGLEGSHPHSIFCKCMASDESQVLLPEQIELFHRYKDEYASRIAEKLHSVFHFHRASNQRNVENDLQLLNSDENIPSFEVGHFKLDFKEPFCFESQVVWLTANEIGFCFVLDEKENLSLAETTLRLIVQQLHDLCRVVLQPSDLVSKIEKIHFVLDKFIPGGKLLFMNHRAVRQTEKEAESVLKLMNN
ncbi:hypothetical protein EGW08_005484 [Elysia chlorotica]|uniref:Uncharacterized protein n=1 Tax=Elysia chlorotica TaxID=188477 RepID=A0A433TYY0_ELYCH|nr:hypothetical protein EGW08_005484 [Elysia chlorotica]